MISLQEQVVHKVSNLSEDNLQFLLEIIDRFMLTDTVKKGETVGSKRIGIAKGQKLYDDYYDFDETSYTLRGTRNTFRLGEKLRVRVDGVDFGMRRTHFGFLKKLS